MDLMVGDTLFCGGIGLGASHGLYTNRVPGHIPHGGKSQAAWCWGSAHVVVCLHPCHAPRQQSLRCHAMTPFSACCESDQLQKGSKQKQHTCVVSISIGTASACACLGGEGSHTVSYHGASHSLLDVYGCCWMLVSTCGCLSGELFTVDT